MCLLAILNRVVDDFPILVAANREEFYDRQGTPPQLWPGSPALVAGLDPRAGGTWLGTNEHRLIVAITNRPKLLPVQPRSRGLLCRELLSCQSARAVCRQAVAQLARRPYAGCNILAIDAAEAFVIHATEGVEVCTLERGFHALSRGDVDDRNDPRVVRALDYLSTQHTSTPCDITSHNAKSARSLSAWFGLLQDLCRDHGNEQDPAMCLHGHDRGTVSSSIIALSGSGPGAYWLHAQGAPCANPYVDYSATLRSLFGPA